MKLRYIFDRVCLQRVHIDLFKGTSAIYNGKIEETGAKALPLIHMHMNSNLIFDYMN
jgi:hypothetical protein